MIHVVTLGRPGWDTARRIADACTPSRLYVHASAPGSPNPFTRCADLFAALFPLGHPIVFVGPAGVAVRCAAPLLRDKHTDPAVVVVDVQGRWAIPVVGAHEGGGNRLASRVAAALSAEPVITTTSEAQKDVVAGVGCRRGTSAQRIADAVRCACRRHDIDPRRIRLVATADIKRNEPGIAQAAAALGASWCTVASARIRALGPCVHPSAAAARHVDLPAVAEPAALSAARKSPCRICRIVQDGITVALVVESST